MAEVLELVMPFRLKSANVHARRHWKGWYAETHIWQGHINVAACRAGDAAKWSLLEGVRMERDNRGHFKPVEIRRQERRRVSVIRIVKYRHHFISDDDNLKFALKPLLDALKRAGYIYDDKREWLDQPALPEQRVAEDGIARTIVRIERVSHEGTHAA